MRRLTLATLFLAALASSGIGCDKMPWSSSSSSDKKSDDKSTKDKKKSSDDDDDKSKKKKSSDDDDDDKSAKKKKKGDDDDDDDDKSAKKKKSSDDDDDDGGFNTGVAACDDYLALYKKCTIDTLPASAQKTGKDSLKTMEDAYKKAAAGGGAAKSATKDGCVQAMDALKKSNKACK